MIKYCISYFLLLFILYLFINDYLYEKKMIENFESDPQIDIEDLRLLTKFTHSLVKGEPIKITPFVFIFIKYKKFKIFLYCCHLILAGGKLNHLDPNSKPISNTIRNKCTCASVC